MNIVVINWRDVRNPRAGGAETYVHEIAKRWVRDGHRVRFLTAGFRGAPRTETIEGIEITRTGNRVTVYAFVAVRLLFGYARGAGAVVDTENGIPFFAPWFARGIPVTLLMLHVHKRVFHSQLPIPAAVLLSFIETRVMPWAYRKAAWIAISPSTASEIAREFRPRPAAVTIAQSGIGQGLRPGARSAAPTIVYVGRLQPYKRLDALLRALASVRERLPGARAVIAGSGDSLADLRAQAKALGLADAVRFEGYVSEERKAEILREGWCFATPSSMEGWGIAAIEAAASGLPAVAFDVPGLRDAIVEGRTGFLARDEAAFAQAIYHVLSDAALRERMASEAVEHAARFSWDATARTFFAALAGR